MKDKLYEYANLMLKCLKLEDKKYLFVTIPDYLLDFKNILEECAKNYNLNDIHFEITHPFKQHEYLINLDLENIYKTPLFDKSIYNKYAKLDSAFLFIQSMIPNLMNDVDPEILKKANLYSRSTQKYFRSLYENNLLNWCIVGVPNKYWALDGLKISLDELWNIIFDICLVTGDNTSYDKWIKKLDNMVITANTLNKYKFKYLKYSNSIGTDLTIYLPKNSLWKSGYGINNTICNLPTEEVFTSPLYNKTDGIVYSTKPLFYNNMLIDNFYLKFSDGKVVDYHAEVGEEILKSIIETDDYSCYLGECALVSYNSIINNTGIIFKETLYDENASCHLALGLGFSECLDIHDNSNIVDLREYGINVSKTHVDFMIGSADLNIIGVTEDNENIQIMLDGNIVI
jgi:aminopeptidase